ncbi:MAG: hypothetical protein ABR915_10565 [Thermoguttaceae bacterium]
MFDKPLVDLAAPKDEIRLGEALVPPQLQAAAAAKPARPAGN